MVYHRSFRFDIPGGFLHGVRVVIEIHVHTLLVAEHGQHAEGAEYKRYYGLLPLQLRHQALADVDVHHHALGGPVVHLLDFLVLINVLQDHVLVVGMGRILRGEHKLLPPRVALDGQVDQRHNAVDVKLAGRLQESVGADLRICGPLLIGCPHQLPGNAGKDGIDGHVVGLLAVQRGDNQVQQPGGPERTGPGLVQ